MLSSAAVLEVVEVSEVVRAVVSEAVIDVVVVLEAVTQTQKELGQRL